MNIAILSRAEQLYSTQSLLKAAEVKNHDIEIIDPAYCNLMIVNNKAVLQYHDQIIDDLDAIIPRIGASNTYRGASIVRHFESMGRSDVEIQTLAIYQILYHCCLLQQNLIKHL